MSTDNNARVAVAFMCKTQNGSGRECIALLHRTDDNNWELPGGKIDPGETPFIAALRELKEETGIVPKEYEAWPDVYAMYSKVMSNKGLFIFLVFQAQLEEMQSVRIEPGKHHDAVEWVPVDEVESRQLAPVVRDLLTNFDWEEERTYEGRGGEP